MPDKKLEKVLFSWLKIQKLKALPVKIMQDGSCRIKLFGGNNDVRAYFNDVSTKLDSIVIAPQEDMKSQIFNIILAVADTVILDIGNEKSAIFDLR